MDFLYYNETYYVLVCARCQCVIVPGALPSHLRAFHKAVATSAVIKECLRVFSSRPMRPAKQTFLDNPAETVAVIPHLALHLDGISCQLCPPPRYTCRLRRAMNQHLREAHSWEKTPLGVPQLRPMPRRWPLSTLPPRPSSARLST